jgi:hypothetical protein
LDVPSERTFRRLLKQINPGELKAVQVVWMAQEDPQVLALAHLGCQGGQKRAIRTKTFFAENS